MKSVLRDILPHSVACNYYSSRHVTHCEDFLSLDQKSANEIEYRHSNPRGYSGND